MIIFLHLRSYLPSVQCLMKFLETEIEVFRRTPPPPFPANSSYALLGKEKNKKAREAIVNSRHYGAREPRV